MTPSTSRPGPRRKPEPDGPLVAVCSGQRCAALRERKGEVEALRSSIRHTPGGVLVATECLGPCHLASVAVVACRDGVAGTTGPGVWLAGIDAPARALALTAWVEGGGATHDGGTPDLPIALTDAIITVVAHRPRPEST